MINPLYEEFPESIEIDGEEYGVLTDFREWIRFSDMLGDNDLTDEEKLHLMTNWLTETPRKITAELVNAVFAFYRADALNPDPVESDNEDTSASGFHGSDHQRRNSCCSCGRRQLGRYKWQCSEGGFE